MCLNLFKKINQKQELLWNPLKLDILKTCTRAILSCDSWPVMEKRKLNEDGNEIKKPRINKKMHALQMAYCGEGYFGLQRNQRKKTIEEDLMIALQKAALVNDEEFEKQQLVNFQRAARTDKNVSAVGQVVNLLLKPGVQADEINLYLSDAVRVLSVKRVTKGFNAKNSCDARSYSYTCPSFAFAPKQFKGNEEYKISEEVLNNLKEISSLYLGNHNYHNFTSGRKPLDPSCKRHILNIEWAGPFIKDGLELLTFMVKGQSFMLHQIRKMVGTMMAISRGYVSTDYITRAFDPKEIFCLPVAPGLGLLLEQVHYDWYNNRYGKNEIHPKLDFIDVKDAMIEFKERKIYPIIMKGEIEDKSMLRYMETLDVHYEEYHTIENLLQAVEDPAVTNTDDADVEKTEFNEVHSNSEDSIKICDVKST